MNITQAKLIVGFRTRHILPENCAALEVMNTLYGAGTTSKLFMNVREKLSLCYYCASRYSRHMGLLLVDSGVLESNAEPAEREIRAQLAAIAEGDFTDDELQQARLYLSNSFRGAGGSVGSLTAYWLSEIASGTMRSPDAAALEFEGVTRQDVEHAAAGWRTDTVYLLAPQEGQQT